MDKNIMGKKKRQRKITVFCSIEGQREGILLEYLKEIYSDGNKMSFPDNPIKGGNPNVIVASAIRNTHYDRVFAWIDEDKDLNEATRQKLAECWRLIESESKEILSYDLSQLQNRFYPANRKPVLIVSQPVCVDALILKILDKKCPHHSYDPSQRDKQIGDLKNALAECFKKNKNHLEYYRTYLNKEILETKRKEIPELDLLIKMVSP